MESDVMSLLIQQMDEEKLAMASALVSGSAMDFPEYKRMVGVVRGLELGQRIVGEMTERLRKQE